MRIRLQSQMLQDFFIHDFVMAFLNSRLFNWGGEPSSASGI